MLAITIGAETSVLLPDNASECTQMQDRDLPSWLDGLMRALLLERGHRAVLFLMHDPVRKIIVADQHDLGL